MRVKIDYTYEYAKGFSTMNDDNKKTILLVEDEAIIAITTKTSLEKSGYTVLSVQSGEKAVETCKTNRSIQLILMDLNLGNGINGSQAADLILKDRELPIIFLTSHTDTEMVEKIKKIAFYGYVVKNSGFFVLEASIEMAFKLFNAQKKLKLLLDGAKAIISSKTKEEICSNLLVNFCEIIGADQIFLRLIDVEKKEIVLDVSSGFEPRDSALGYEEYMAGISGLVIKNGKTILSTSPDDGIEPNETKARRCAKNTGSLIVAPLTVSGHIIGTITVINRLENRVFTEKDAELLGMLADQAADSINRAHLEEKLGESESRLREVLENSLDVSYKRNLVTDSYEYLSPGFSRLSGYTQEEFTGLKVGKILSLTHPEDLPGLEHVTAESLTGKSGAAYRVTYRFKNKKGEYRCFSDKFTVLHDQNGKATARIGSISDITREKQAEARVQALLAEKELILKEVHHRIKNNMNSIYGLLILQAGTLNDPIAIHALEDAGSRVQSMMILYDKLFKAEDVTGMSLAEYLPPLIEQIMANYSNQNSVRIEEKIDDFILNAKKLQPIGIIMNELITNTMKYAFSGKADALITISASLKDSTVTLIVADNGSGMPPSIDFQHSTKFGLVLVSELVRQISGTIRIERNGGTQIILEFEK